MTDAGFSVKRFLPRALLLMILGGVVWRYTYTFNADFAVWMTKWLHRLFGRPSPYMFCDESRLYWHATMFVPEFGLILASYWIGWSGRILRILAVYIAHSLLTACTITIHESPYLQQNEFVNVATSTLVNANYLLFGVVAWVLVAGPWYHRAGASETRGIWKVVSNWPVRLIVFCIALWLTVPLFAATGTDDAMIARAKLADAMQAIPWFPHPSNVDEDRLAVEQKKRDLLAVEALLAMQRVIELELEVADNRDPSVKSASVWFLTAHMLASLRPENLAQRQDYKIRAAAALQRARDARSR